MLVRCLGYTEEFIKKICGGVTFDTCDLQVTQSKLLR